jgi:hypothetical protein
MTECKLEAVNYAPDWSKLENLLPELKMFSDLAEKAKALIFIEKWRPELKPDIMKCYHEVGHASGNKCITQYFTNHIVDALLGITATYGIFSNYKYHHSGTGVGVESSANTALGTPVGSRVVGTQINYAPSQYRSVGEITYDGDYTIAEHGLFNASTGDTLMDRTRLSSAQVVHSGNKIIFTYTVTFVPGG